MQKIIAKYGAAAHLSLLAAAPLFMFPFWSGETMAVVLLWISIPTALWCLMEPSLQRGERLNQARKRVRKALMRDPLFWCLVLVVIVTVIRALNVGIGMSYDAENAKWSISKSICPLFPGCFGRVGVFPAAAAVAALVLIQGCRQVLGRSARTVFLLVSSALSGTAAAIAVLFVGFGNAVAREAFVCSPTMSFCVGMAFALHLFGGTVALGAAFERVWRLAIPFCLLAVAGNLAGVLAFFPAFSVVIVLLAEVLLIVLLFVYAVKVLPASGEFKVLVTLGVSLSLGGLLATAMLPSDIFVGRLAPLVDYRFFPEGFDEIRGALSEIARRTWFSNPWIGTGLGSFPLDFRFMADDAVWKLVREEALSVPNAWWHLLAERGIVGALLIVLPAGFLIVTFVQRLIGSLPIRFIPNPAVFLFPLVLVTLAVVGTFSCSVLRPDVLMTAGAFLALSANSFMRRRGGKNG